MPSKQRLGVGNGACATTATGASSSGDKSKGMGMVNGAVREIVGVEHGADEDEEPRKITITVYRVSTLSHIQHCHMVAADRLCKWFSDPRLTKWGKALDLLCLSVH